MSLVVPAVLTLYDGVDKFEAKHLRKMVAALRDSLRKRFLGIFQELKMEYSVDPSRGPFCDRIYITAAVLDPNQKLMWVDNDVHISNPDSLDDVDDDPGQIDLLKAGIKGKHTQITISTLSDL